MTEGRLAVDGGPGGHKQHGGELNLARGARYGTFMPGHGSRRWDLLGPSSMGCSKIGANGGAGDAEDYLQISQAITTRRFYRGMGIGWRTPALVVPLYQPLWRWRQRS